MGPGAEVQDHPIYNRIEKKKLLTLNPRYDINDRVNRQRYENNIVYNCIPYVQKIEERLNMLNGATEDIKKTPSKQRIGEL